MSEAVSNAYLLVAGWMDMGPHRGLGCAVSGCSNPGRWVFEDALADRVCTGHAVRELATGAQR